MKLGAAERLDVAGVDRTGEENRHISMERNRKVSSGRQPKQHGVDENIDM
jgi:hypothetical protein